MDVFSTECTIDIIPAKDIPVVMVVRPDKSRSWYTRSELESGITVPKDSVLHFFTPDSNDMFGFDTTE